MEIDINSSKEVVASCEDFDWIVEYINDGSDDNTKTIITTYFPDTVTMDFSSITHTRNDAVSLSTYNNVNPLSSSYLSGGQLPDGSRFMEIDINKLHEDQ